MPFRKILVPVDFSPHSAEVLRIAADLSGRYGAKLTLIHVFQPFAYALPDGYVLHTANQLGQMLSLFEQQLLESKKAAETAGAVAVDTEQLQGAPDAEIVEFAEAQQFDLIVMGTHGRTGLKHALIGSVAERVVRRAPCPVLTVRSPKTVQ